MRGNEPRDARLQPVCNLVHTHRLVFLLVPSAPRPCLAYLVFQGGARQGGAEGSATASNLLAFCPLRRKHLSFGASPARFHLPDHYGPHGQPSHHSPRHLVRSGGAQRLDLHSSPLPRRRGACSPQTIPNTTLTRNARRARGPLPPQYTHRGPGHSSSTRSRPTTRCACSWRRGLQRTRRPAPPTPPPPPPPTPTPTPIPTPTPTPTLWQLFPVHILGA